MNAASLLAVLDPAVIRHERLVVQAEAASRGVAPVNYALMLRFGAEKHGLPHFEEYGLRTVSDEAVAEWARARFNQASCAFVFTGPPPSDVAIGLAAGTAVPPPEPEPIPYLSFPSAVGFGLEGKVIASFVCERSDAAAIAVNIAQRRLQEQLRARAGTTYGIDLDYALLSATKAHVVFTADVRARYTVEARNNFVATFDVLAEDGPSDEELSEYNARADAADRDPSSVSGMVFNCAQEHLLGLPAVQPREIVEARRAVTTDDVAHALAEMLPTLLLVLPSGSPLPAGRFTAYPLEVTPLTGRRHRRRRTGPLRRRPGDEVLVVTDEGMTLHTDNATTVRFDACSALLRWQDGTRGLFGSDACYFEVDPAVWEDGSAVVERIDRSVAEAIVVPMDDEPPPPRDPDLVAAGEAWEARDAERALAHLDVGLERVPDDADGWRLRATALDALGRRAEAARDLEHALGRNPADLGLLVDAACMLAGLGEHKRALQLTDRAAELHPEDASAWTARGRALQAAGRLGEADAAHRRARALDLHADSASARPLGTKETGLSETAPFPSA